MENIYQGVITLLLLALSIFYAFHLHKQGKHVQALWLYMIAGFVLRFYCACDMYLHTWDERYHALVAKNFLKHWYKPTLYDNPVLGYNNASWPLSHIWLHKQPLPMWLMAISIKLFGVNEIAVRLPSVIMSTVGIKLLYDIAKYYYSLQTAFIAAFLFASQGTIIELAAGRWATDHIDITFLFFTLASVWALVQYVQTDKRRYNLAAGLLLGCALFTKWLPALIILPVWALLVYDWKKKLSMQVLLQFVCFTVAAAIIVLPWHIYIRMAYPAEAAIEYGHISKHFTETLDGQGGNFFYHFDKMRIMFGELVYIPVVWFTFHAFKHLRDLKSLSLVIWLWGVYLFFSFAATKMQAYTIIAAPPLFIIIAHAYSMFKLYATEYPKYRWMFLVLAYGFVFIPIHYTIERVKPFEMATRKQVWAEKLKDIGRSDINSPRTILVNCNYPVEAMFYTDCIAYANKPDRKTIEELESKGYKVVVMQPL